MRKHTRRGLGLLVAPVVAGFGLMATATSAAAATDDLFLSEYVEGSSNNKALEIYNGTGAGVDLAAAGYSVQMHFNGAAVPGLTIDLTGTVVDGDVFVLANSGAAAAILAQADQTNGSGWFNGDDAVVLRKGTAVLDVIGQVGNDPGTQWGSGLASTADNTLRRTSSVTRGDANGADAFNPAAEWDGFAVDTFDGLGSHLGDPPGEPPPPSSDCGDPATSISEVQGSGAATPLSGQRVAVEGVVTAVHPNLNGYYVQEEAGDADADPATSEGVFVFVGGGQGPSIPVEEGEAVRVVGTASEFVTSGGASSQTQLTNDPTATVCDVPSTSVEPTALTFPLASPDDLEHYEGMLVELVDELAISEYFNYDRFGEVQLAKPLDGLDRLHTPTAVVEPGPAAQALAAEYERRTIMLDDANNDQNPDVVPHPGNGEPFSLDNRFRGGDTVTGVQGVVDHTFGLYRVQPTDYGQYTAVNPRPQDAPDVGGSVQVASFNVLNYFLTFGGACGPEQDEDCRGADDAEELERQRAKIVAALAELDADVVGLMEMENTPGVEPAADLVEGLNALLGEGTYAYLDTGVIGTDAIRLGMLYKPATVRPVGEFAVLDSSVDPRFVDTANRPMLTQTFDEVATGARFSVSVNHLKSKGSPCTGDPDTGDGQGNCNETRTAAAEAIVDFLAGDPTGSGDPDHLVIGDLNSYDHEDPIDVLVGAGYTDLVKKYGGEYAYGYVFDGMVGYLDHALSNPTLTPQVTGAAEWHINADEPDLLDYDTTFKSPGQDALYQPNPYRSSDHDPVLVGLDLKAATPDECYTDGAQTVESYTKGPRVNGTRVPPGHTDASQALGRSDPGGDDPYWVTLGLQGEIVLRFANPIQNNNGGQADLRIVDVDDGGKGRADMARVYVSSDGTTWTEVGAVTGTGLVDLGTVTSAAEYVKVVDSTDRNGWVNPATDGYDLDAVEVVSGCVA